MYIHLLTFFNGMYWCKAVMGRHTHTHTQIYTHVTEILLLLYESNYIPQDAVNTDGTEASQ